MLGLFSSSKSDWGSYIVFVAKYASKKIGALICSMKFLFPEFTLYLYKSTTFPGLEYCYVKIGYEGKDSEYYTQSQL